jgi:serine phosphatase RsbU (regulator of sigma subunit)/anti-sigma regulatory factor (Ser/Thr protein kinase)
MKSRFISIQLRIFLTFSLAFALILGGGGWAVAQFFSASEHRQLQTQQFSLVSLLASVMDEKISSYLGGLQAVVKDCPKGFERDSWAANQWLMDRRGIRSAFTQGVFLLSPQGRLLATNAPAPLPADQLEALQPFFQKVAATRQGGTSDAFRLKADGPLAVLMAAPQVDPQGRTALLLAGLLPLDFREFLGTQADHSLPNGEFLVLLDEGQDRILIHPQTDRLTATWGLGSPLAPHLGNEGITERLDAKGQRLLTSVKHLQSVPWVLAANAPLARVHAPIDRFIRSVKIATAASLALSLILAWLLSHGLTENLEAFTRQVEEAAEQPLGQRSIQKKANDETGLLVDAFNGLMAKLDVQAAQLLETQNRADEELGLAKHVLQRLVEPGLATLPEHLHMETLQTHRINGDACTYREGLPGLHFGLLCDATGHGLTAGISTLPALQAFLSMVSRDLPLESIYREINQKVHDLMPVGRFLCLLLIRLDLRNDTLSVLNAGLPDAILCLPNGERRRFASRNLPAGIRGRVDTPVVETVAALPGARLLAFTDGVLDLFPGEEADQRLLQGLETSLLEVHRCSIQETLALAIHDQEQHDDVSWALWEVPPRVEPILPRVETRSDQVPLELDENLALEWTFAPQKHPVRELLPEIIRLLSSRGLGAEAEHTLAMALSEALNNAVDHGLLGLDSALKAHGFEEYEALRQLYLAALYQGCVRVAVRLRTLPSGPLQEVVVEVEDTGPGFDWRTFTEPTPGTKPSGHGLMLLRALTRDLTFNEAGNQIRFTIPCA